jgi:methionine--tRNA ligase beta chain
MIDFNEFKKVEMKIATIKDVEDIPGKDRLFKLRVSLGDEERTLVAGIKGIYSAEELKGKQVVVVTNLKPATIAGVESNGMLLAAVEGENVVLLSPDKPIKDGAGVE